MTGRPITSWAQVPEYQEERALAKRLREAIQWCKVDTGITQSNDQKMDPEARMTMEKCLTKNYLLAKGMDYFGKRDLIYLDMRGQDEIDQLYTKAYTPPAVTDGGDDDE